jgi:two-component system, chemotaxis family, sensor kinase Cph1
MNLRKELYDRKHRLWHYLVAFLVGWTLIVISLLVWNASQIQRNVQEMAINEARINFNRDQAFRLWATSHGGVYVPIDEHTPPNPYLAHIPDRDIETPSGVQLTLMNPEYMMGQMSEDFPDLYGVPGHITGLNHLQPKNAPDDWERAALNAFEQGETEVTEFTEIDGEPYLRLMQPMITQEGCLKCHGFQGYEVGDVRGGVGVSVPTTDYLARRDQRIMTDVWSMGLLWVLGLGGTGLAARGVGRYLNEREQAAKTLQEQQSLLQTIFAASPDFLTLKDRNLVYQAINPAYCEFLGKKEDDIVGKTAFDVFSRDDAEGHHVGDIAVMESGLSRIIEAEIIGAEGKLWGQVIKTPIKDKDGACVGVLASLRDITAHKQMETMLREEEARTREILEMLRMELEQEKELGELKSRFVSMTSHEFRTPLAIIQATSESLQYYLDKMDEEQKVKRFAKIKNQVTHITMMLDNVLSIGSLDAGATEFRPELLDLDALIKEILSELRQTETEHQFVYSCAGECGKVSADSTLMRQIIMNLLSNAINYSPEGDIGLMLSDNNNYVILKITDEGIGIPEKDHVHLFENFHRGSNVDTISGAGLGLAIAKHAVELHNGTITFTSEVGVGTTFAVTIPKTQSEDTRDDQDTNN